MIRAELLVPENHPHLRYVKGSGIEFRLRENDSWRSVNAADSALRPAIADMALSAWRNVLLKQHLAHPSWECDTTPAIDVACQACVHWEEFRHKVEFF